LQPNSPVKLKALQSQIHVIILRKIGSKCYKLPLEATTHKYNLKMEHLKVCKSCWKVSPASVPPYTSLYHKEQVIRRCF